MNISFQRIFFAIATIIAIFAILILAKPVLIPLSFALLLSFILLPLCKKFESWKINRIFSVVLTFFIMIVFVAVAIYLFSSQIIRLSEEFSDFKDKMLQVLTDITLYLNQNVNIMPDIGRDELIDRLKTYFSQSAGIILGQTFTGTTSFITGLLACMVFTFLLLIYRSGLTYAVTQFYPENQQTRVVQMLIRVQQVGKKYLLGMIMMIVILGLINSVGLLVLGIDNAFLFGFLASFIAIIPYIGTIVGAAIPVLYSFVIYDSLWKPVSVAILFWVVQVIEANYLSPKIVGGTLKINALAAILSIILGAAVWGIAGMILFLPFTAMLKVVSEEYIQLKPLAYLIGEQNVKTNTSKKLPDKWAHFKKSFFKS
jgi:predicted PurR-regulated permease PerM